MAGQALHPIPHNDCVVDGVGVVCRPRVLSPCLLPTRLCVAQSLLTPCPRKQDGNPSCKMWGWYWDGNMCTTATLFVSTPLATWKCFDQWPALCSNGRSADRNDGQAPAPTRRTTAQLLVPGTTTRPSSRLPTVVARVRSSPAERARPCSSSPDVSCGMRGQVTRETNIGTCEKL